MIKKYTFYNWKFYTCNFIYWSDVCLSCGHTRQPDRSTQKMYITMNQRRLSHLATCDRNSNMTDSICWLLQLKCIPCCYAAGQTRWPGPPSSHSSLRYVVVVVWQASLFHFLNHSVWWLELLVQFFESYESLHFSKTRPVAECDHHPTTISQIKKLHYQVF